jgi:BirA family biotin operon repressor/biotin-[acetyl-CoA-carboxylase] ligase
VWRALKTVYPTLAFSLKAPNDIYLNKAKLAGILIESVEMGTRRRTAIGLGLNATAAPKGKDFSATALTDALADVLAADQFTTSTWSAFLDQLSDELKQAVAHGVKTELSELDRTELREALNRNPNLKAPILEVDANGQLALSSGLVRWQEL